MLDRAVIEDVMAGAITDQDRQTYGLAELQEMQRQAVEDFLETMSDTEVGPGLQGRTGKEMIMSDLMSYRSWERG